MSEIGRVYFIVITILIFIIALHDQNIILLLFTLFTVCIVHLIIIFIWLVTEIVRELESDRSVLERTSACHLRINIVLLYFFDDEIRRALRWSLWLFALLCLDS